jgi:hypothetical protein
MKITRPSRKAAIGKLSQQRQRPSEGAASGPPPRAALARVAAESRGSELEAAGRFESMCAEVRGWTLEIFRNVMRIALHLREMKPLYEGLTGTGWGKRRKSADVHSFDEEVARRTGVDRSLIRRYCRIGQIDPQTSARIEGKSEIEGNLSLLYRLVQLDIDTRQKALDAYEREGRPALDRVLREAQPPARSRSAVAPLSARPGEGEQSEFEDVRPLPEAEGPIAAPALRLPPESSEVQLKLRHTFEVPPIGEWFELELDKEWKLRLNVIMDADTVSSISVEIVPGPTHAVAKSRFGKFVLGARPVVRTNGA